MLVGVVDHACQSEHRVRHRVVAVRRETQWQVSTELCNDQPRDACGYIAADAARHSREAALAEANARHRVKLPDYGRLERVDCGNQNASPERYGPHSGQR